MKFSLRLAACAAILVCAAAAPAAAEPDGRVSISGADVAAVHNRIVQEARDVCDEGYVPAVHSLRDLRTCVRLTIDDAVARSRREDLMAFHESLDSAARYQTTLASAD